MRVRGRSLALVLLALSVLVGCADQPDVASSVLRYYGKGQFWEASITLTVTDQ